jgi:NADP-dependent 3-hydroxy acid dehydrogenase YdfG
MQSVLANQVAVITGASSGVGRSLAIALGTEGAQLFLIGRRIGALEEVAKAAAAQEQPVAVCQADLTVDADVRRLCSELQQRFGKVDILVHSAGIIELGPVESAPVKSFDEQYRCNVRAPFILTQALLPLLKESHGQIVFVNSTAGLEARAKVGQYAATKHALRALTDSLREEVNGEGVRVLSLFLGRTATPMQEAIFRVEGRPYRPEDLLQPEDAASMLLAALRLPRGAEVTEIRIRPAVKSY